MSSSYPRRRFLADISKTATIVSFTGLTSSSLLAGNKKYDLLSADFTIGYEQTPLPFSYTDLEPVIDAQTMEIHYSRHAAAYASHLRDAAKAEGVNMKDPVDKIFPIISKYSSKLRNNGGGHYNHEFFWRCMCKNGRAIEEGKLKQEIIKQFGGWESFQVQFSDAAKSRFGSGWAWLFADKDKQLRIGSTPNQDNPLMDVSEIKGIPLLGLDVWEHAYYLKYQNKRADYIAGWWKVVNWKSVEERFLGV
jgi:Fe-Mn family superoxide dismutase